MTATSVNFNHSGKHELQLAAFHSQNPCNSNTNLKLFSYKLFLLSEKVLMLVDLKEITYHCVLNVKGYGKCQKNIYCRGLNCCK